MSKGKVTKIRKLGLGSVFGIRKGDYLEQWKIIGRPGKSGTIGNVTTYTVKATFQPYSKTDQYDPGKEAKYFDINTEVIEIAPPRKDFDAIDQRDQPDSVQSVEELAKQVGADFNTEVDGGDLEAMIDEEPK